MHLLPCFSRKRCCARRAGRKACPSSTFHKSACSILTAMSCSTSSELVPGESIKDGPVTIPSCSPSIWMTLERSASLAAPSVLRSRCSWLSNFLSRAASCSLASRQRDKSPTTSHRDTYRRRRGGTCLVVCRGSVDCRTRVSASGSRALRRHPAGFLRSLPTIEGKANGQRDHHQRLAARV